MVTDSKELAKIFYKNTRNSDITLDELRYLAKAYITLYNCLYDKSIDCDAFSHQVIELLRKKLYNENKKE